MFWAVIDIGWDVVSKREMVSWGSIGTIRFWSFEIVTSSSLFDAVDVVVDVVVAWETVKADSTGDDDDDDEDELSLVDKYRLGAAALVSPNDDNDDNEEEEEMAEETVDSTVKPRNAIRENFIFLTKQNSHLKGLTWDDFTWVWQYDEWIEWTNGSALSSIPIIIVSYRIVWLHLGMWWKIRMDC